jgi:hypothetical protein
MIAVLLALPYLLALCFGQVVFQSGRLRPLHNEMVFHSEDLPVYRLPMIDNEALMAEEEGARALGDLQWGEYRFAKSFDIQIDLQQPSAVRNSKVWAYRFESPSAHSLSLSFDQFHLPEGVEVYVVSDRQEVQGPFTSHNNKESGRFATWPLEASALTLEVYAPGSMDSIKLRVGRLVHGYRPMRDSGHCNLDVACDLGPEWDAQVRSVAMILTKSGTGYCSGTMLNNAAGNGRQLFLTAYHCITSSDVSDNLLRFNYQSRQCSNKSDVLPKMTVHGLKKLSMWRSSDFALLEVQEQIPESYGVYLSGWSASDISPSSAVGIHHPSGDIKKFSVSNTTLEHSCWGWCSAKDALNHWKIPQWLKGTTEPGSSGSGLFDGKSKRLVGQLHGGTASCTRKNGYDMYGKLSYSYSRAEVEKERLNPYLDPDATGAEYVDGIDLHEARQGYRFNLRFQSN